MIDINTLISNALIAAVQQATAHLVERIANLEALTDRVVALENQAIVTSNAVDARISALENNPAQGVEPAITIDEARMVEALNSQEWFWEKLHNTINDNVVSRVEEALDEHCSNYDHDNYDEIASKVDDADFDEFVTNGDLGERVREHVEDALNNASVSFSI